MVIRKGYIIVVVISVIIVGLIIGYFLRSTGIGNISQDLIRDASVELSRPPQLLYVEEGIAWLGLEIKVSIAGEEKKAFEDYFLQWEVPGLTSKYDPAWNQDETNYIFPIWPPSQPGEYRLFITEADNADVRPIEHVLNFSGVIEKQSTYKVTQDGVAELAIEGIDLNLIEDVYHVTNNIIDPFPALRTENGRLGTKLSDGFHVYIFRIGDQWYLTRVIANSAIQAESIN